MIPDTAAPAQAVPGKPMLFQIRSLLPGLALCVGVTALAFVAAKAEMALFGEAWIEALVLAILIGTTLRTAWTPSARWQPGIAFSAKILLEVAVVLLGASVSAATILSAGPALLLGIAGVVALALLAGFGIGRLLGLPVRMAVLVACGNAICGNSAIAAVAPVIDAHSDDVAASIAFTAVLGVAVVLGLPLLGIGLRLSGVQYGALAGLTVYAVPQVIAAAAPLGATAVQVGTLVKLVRVLMLGPVCLLLSLLAPWLGGEAVDADAGNGARGHPADGGVDGGAGAGGRCADGGAGRRTGDGGGGAVPSGAGHDQPDPDPPDRPDLRLGPENGRESTSGSRGPH